VSGYQDNILLGYQDSSVSEIVREFPSTSQHLFFNRLSFMQSRAVNPLDNSVMTSSDILENKKSRNILYIFDTLDIFFKILSSKFGQIKLFYDRYFYQRRDSNCLTLHYRPRCTVRTFNCLHATGLGAPYVRKYYYIITLRPGQQLKFKPSDLQKLKIKIRRQSARSCCQMLTALKSRLYLFVKASRWKEIEIS
jgi:hypothetical protein